MFHASRTFHEKVDEGNSNASVIITKVNEKGDEHKTLNNDLFRFPLLLLLLSLVLPSRVHLLLFFL